MKEYIRFIKFTLFSASAGLIEIGTFALLKVLCFWAATFSETPSTTIYRDA